MIVIKFINQWLLKSAKIIVAQNVEMRNQLLEYYRLPDDKVVAINNQLMWITVVRLQRAQRTIPPGEVNF